MAAVAADHKRRANISFRKKQFAEPQFKQQEYGQRLNFYSLPPTAEITLDEFEGWAIHRLKVLAELEACSFRNRSQEETAEYMRPILEKYLPLAQNSSRSPAISEERKRDHYSHFILRLAFSSTEELRRRFTRLESQLFRLRYQSNDTRDRQAFVDGLNFDWERVSEEERAQVSVQLSAMNTQYKRSEEDGWFKVDWERVPDLVESRRVFLLAGKAYVPLREQATMVFSEFSRRLEQALEQTARAIPRLDEDDRLTPILKHLSQNFMAPGAAYDESEVLPGAAVSAVSIDSLAGHFPLCMRNLHMQLRKNSHLKHQGRFQYGLFLKGLGLPLEEALVFWRHSFKLITDETFVKEYQYNVRHAYGDVGGDANRRGRGYTPFSCQKLTTETLPAPGQHHGCPYRTYTPDNLTTLLQATGISDRALLQDVQKDVGNQRYHIACNRVFEASHASQIRKVKEDGTWGAAQLDTILHPNEYFKRSYLLHNLGSAADVAKREVTMDVDGA